MDANTRNEIAAGLFMVIGMLLFAVSIWVLGRERQIFADQEPYFATFTDVKGLQAGAPVRLSGISIGRVDEVGFSGDLQDQKVQVKLLINENYVERIREDSVATIDTQGLLGDRLVNISSGTQQKQLLPGATIVTSEAPDISQVMARASEAVDNITEITRSVKKVAVKFEGNTLESITDSARNIAALTGEIKDGEGLLHRLFYSKTDGKTVIEGVKKASSAIGELMKQAKDGNGVVHALFYEDGAGTVEALMKAADSFSETSVYVNNLIADVRDGEGFLHDLIYDDAPAEFDKIIKDFKLVSANLQKASQALARGEGTIGALLIDSQLYDNLVEVTDGAKRSFILRTAIRSAMSN